jgi:hypothetical protein
MSAGAVIFGVLSGLGVGAGLVWLWLRAWLKTPHRSRQPLPVQRLVLALLQGGLAALLGGWLLGGIADLAVAPSSYDRDSSYYSKDPSYSYDQHKRAYDDYSRRRNRVEVLASVIGVLSGGALLGTCLWLLLGRWHKARGRAEQERDAKIEELLAEFPKECQAWGGPSALRDAELVQEVVRELKSSPRKTGR